MVARAPRKRMYRTMQGRMVDIEKLRSANESVPAVGNMNVNARGDIVGPGGSIATPKEAIISKYYEAPKGVVDDTPTKAKITPAPKTEPKKTVKSMTPIAEAKPVAEKKAEPAPKTVTKTVSAFKPETENKSSKGIDAALDGID